MNPSENGGDGSNLPVVPHSENKKVCRFCKREFKCGRGLGGHIKVHFKGRKLTKFTHEKKKNGRGFQSSTAAGHQKDSEVSGGEITDLSKSLAGCDWKVQNKRGSNELRNKSVLVEHDSSDDDHVECDNEDWCDNDDYDNIRLRNKLMRHGLNTIAHNICWTKRELMCKVCNEYFKTFYAVSHHVDECGSINNDVVDEEEVVEGPSMEVNQVAGEAAAEGREGVTEDCVERKEDEERGESGIGDKNQGFGGVGEGMGGEESNEGNDGVGEEVNGKSGGGGSMDQEISTSVTTPKMLDFDLNEMPPMED